MAKVTDGYPVPLAYRERIKDILQPRYGKVYRDAEQFFYQSSDENDPLNGKCRPKWAVLSVDGGGVKGIIPAAILAQLEWVLRAEVAEWKKAVLNPSLSDPEGLLDLRRAFVAMVDREIPVAATMLESCTPETLELSDFFNLMSGTSTGALIVGLLAHPEPAMTDGHPSGRAEQAWQLYTKEGGRIFNPDTKLKPGCFGIPCCELVRFRGFDHKPLEGILRNLVNYPACNSKVPLLLTTFDFSRNSPVLFSTKGASRKRSFPDHQLRPDIKMSEISRASAAAPTMFVPKKLIGDQGTKRLFLDGAFVANNPIQHALQWAADRPYYTVEQGYLDRISLDRTLVLSMGTGSSNIPPAYKGFLNPNEKEKEWGKGGWASPAITAALDGNAKAAHQAAASSFANADLMPAYVRLQPKLRDRGLLSGTNAKNRARLVFAANYYLQNKKLKDVVASPPARNHQVLRFSEDLRRSVEGRLGDPIPATDPTTEAMNQTNAERLVDFAVLLIKNWLVRHKAMEEHEDDFAAERRRMDFEAMLSCLRSGNESLAAEGLEQLVSKWEEWEHGKESVLLAVQSVTDLDFSIQSGGAVAVEETKTPGSPSFKGHLSSPPTPSPLNQRPEAAPLQIPFDLPDDLLTSLGKVICIDLGELRRSGPVKPFAADPSQGDCPYPPWVNSGVLTDLKSLTVSPCRLSFSPPPPGLLSFQELAKLDISGCKLDSLSRLKALSHLKELRVTNCQELGGAVTFEHLTLLDVTGCKNLRELPQLPALEKLLAAGSGLSNKHSLVRVLQAKELNALSVTYRRSTAGGCLGTCYTCLPFGSPGFIGRGILPRLPRGEILGFDQTLGRKQLPKVLDTEYSIISKTVDSQMSEQIQGVVVRCLFEDQAEAFLKPYNGPVRLRIVLGSLNANNPDYCSSREIYSRVEKLGPQLHVHRFEGHQLTGLREGAILELRAKYFSPAQVEILHADITLFREAPPQMIHCLDVDHAII